MFFSSNTLERFAKMTFEASFTSLAGFPPMSWQIRLFRDWFARGIVPSAVDVPTGLGKTAVMALWLLAHEQRVALPRRLVYVVDRRAVVDQATDFAIKLRKNLSSERPLSISTLRGQHIDNREWLEDPSATAIIVGTVDMIGSRLLFEGFGVSRKMRPYHAGLLGADTLVVLDEAHLVPPFEKLLEAIETDANQFGPRVNADRTLVPPFKLLSLSATGRERSGTVFQLEESDLDEPHLQQPVTQQRLNARKALTCSPASEKDLPVTLAEAAWKISDQGQNAVRCILYCNSRKTAEAAKVQIDKLIAERKKTGQNTMDSETELFVGARRVFERETAGEKLKEMGFLAGSDTELTGPRFLVATSAGEVGVDLDADHMICDLVAWERMVQRLGRVNRRGEGDAKVVVFDTGAPKPAKADSPNPSEARAIRQHTALHALVGALPQHADGSANVSPGSLRALKTRSVTDDQLRVHIADATSPVPLRPALTRALVDAWSMTSLKEHTGRPEVDPWLRGWVDDEPQTGILWRKHLPIRVKGATVEPKEIEAFFEAAPPHISEILETETWRVVDWLMPVAAKHWEQARQRTKQDDSPDRETPIFHEAADKAQQSPAILSGSDCVAFALSPTGDLVQACKLSDFIPNDKMTPANLRDRFRKILVGKTLVVDAKFGGLTDDGLLSEKVSAPPRHTADDGEDWLNPPTDKPATENKTDKQAPVIRFRVRSIQGKIEERSEADKDWRERLRFATEESDDGESVRWLVIDKWRYDAATEDDRSVGSLQSLKAHQSCAATKARNLADRIGLPAPYTRALVIAARLHDEGKQAERWQRAFNAPRQGSPYAKTKGPCNWRLLDGYRHEFGSLRYAQDDPELKSLPLDLQDLILHMIAAHHGQARPLIPTAGCEDAPPSILAQRARDVALRFACLQQRWGPWGLAWWESLLRAADQQASRENDSKQSYAKQEAD